MGRTSPKMKLSTIFTVFAFAAAEKVIEIYNDQGQVAIVDDADAAREGGRPNFGAPDAQRGPRECMGKKIPQIKNGYFVCHRNLNNSGNKRQEEEVQVPLREGLDRLSQKGQRSWKR